MKLYLDPGHGGSDAGAHGNGMNEKTFNLDVARKIRSILTSHYPDAHVRMSRSDDTTKSLTERTDEANDWGADYFLSIHANSFNGSADGYEDYIHSSLTDSSTTAAHQNTMHENLLKVNQLQDRGTKKSNFHVLRESTMPALLTENGFIDNPEDAALMKDSAWRQTVAQGHVNGLAAIFNLKQTKKTKTFYKIIAGSFRSQSNAKKRADHLKSNGLEAYIAAVTISGETWHRVQAGAFAKWQNAEKYLQVVKANDVSDAYIIKETS
ncbi:sporulation-specific N-acetylmuramoyl-L-alanine amidase [Barrientosiimonas marina]|uniref:N-acetylmuramoyl-L-alanine amidase n=1 Tax=Lentibacillus kimchii TaxID=1542911 RepID=A0ABW2UUF0_9BACI